MQMVAAAKMRKAQSAALAGRPYAALLNRVLQSVAARSQDGGHPLLEARDVAKHLVVVVSTDKGLCGALNTNLLREAAKFDPAKTVFVAVGRKAMQWLVRNQRTVLADFQLKDSMSFLDARMVSRFAMEKFLTGEVDKVSVLFTDFINTLRQVPKEKVVLPVSSLAVTVGVEGSIDDAVVDVQDGGLEYIFEPTQGEVLDAVLPHYVHFEVYQMILDSRASEHSARMVAMKSATDNAKQLIKDLTLEYNKIRQASITTEILEIASAQMILS
jgi:F-type H+-transporting ATPase subunit gamma